MKIKAQSLLSHPNSQCNWMYWLPFTLPTRKHNQNMKFHLYVESWIFVTPHHASYNFTGNRMQVSNITGNIILLLSIHSLRQEQFLLSTPDPQKVVTDFQFCYHKVLYSFHYCDKVFHFLQLRATELPLWLRELYYTLIQEHITYLTRSLKIYIYQEVNFKQFWSTRL